MPWRLICFIIIFAVFLVFITFNLENRCDISFGFKILESVPVFITVFGSFVLGLLSSVPLLFHVRKKYKDGTKSKVTDRKNKDKNINTDDIPIVIAADEKIKDDAANAKKRFFAKRNGGV